MEDPVIKKWFALITDHRISLRDRMFRIVTLTCMVALLLIMPMGQSVWNILALGASLVAMGLIVKYSIKRAHSDRGHGHFRAAAPAVPHQLLFRGRVLQRRTRVVHLLLYLRLHHLAGPAHGRSAGSVHCGNPALLWRGFLLS